MFKNIKLFIENINNSDKRLLLLESQIKMEKIIKKLNGKGVFADLKSAFSKPRSKKIEYNYFSL